MRTWNTLPTAPPQWGKLQGIPSDFSDGKIDWAEIQNKPFGNSGNLLFNSGNRGGTILDNAPDGTPVLQLNRGKTGFLQSDLLVFDFAWQDDANYNARIAMDASRFFVEVDPSHKLCIAGIPSSSVGLPINGVWRDSSGYLRIV